MYRFSIFSVLSAQRQKMRFAALSHFRIPFPSEAKHNEFQLHRFLHRNIRCTHWSPKKRWLFRVLYRPFSMVKDSPVGMSAKYRPPELCRKLALCAFAIQHNIETASPRSFSQGSRSIQKVYPRIMGTRQVANRRKSSTPSRIRTCDLLIRSQLLYPAELSGHMSLFVGQTSSLSECAIKRIPNRRPVWPFNLVFGQPSCLRLGWCAINQFQSQQLNAHESKELILQKMFAIGYVECLANLERLGTQ